MDVNGANFFGAIDMMRERLHTNALPITLPIGKEDTHRMAEANKAFAHFRF